MEIYVTCHTNGCENSGHVIPLIIEPDCAFVICGPCGIIIDDLVDTNSQAVTVPLTTTKEGD